MASIREVYGSYISAAELPTDPLQGTITEIGCEDIQGERKLVLRMDCVAKSVVVNKTNAEKIAESYGEDYDQWPGCELRISRGQTLFRGKQVDCVVLQPRTRATRQPTQHRMPANNDTPW